MGMILVLVGLAPEALAAGEGKEPLAALEVERGLAIPRGWVEVAVAVSDKRAADEWGPGGGGVEWEAGTRWRYTTEALAARVGVASGHELHASLPFHHVRLDLPEGTTTTFGLGDVGVGWRAEWLHRRPPTRGLATDVDLRLPTGAIPPGAPLGSAPVAPPVALGAGVVELSLGALGRAQLGPCAVTAGAAYAHRFAGKPDYAAFDGDSGDWFRPGDEVSGGAEALLQAGPLAFSARARVRAWGEAEGGERDEGLVPDGPLVGVPGTAGWAVEAGPAAQLDLSRGLELVLALDLPLAGAGGALFPVERLTPTRGTTFTVLVAVRR